MQARQAILGSCLQCRTDSTTVDLQAFAYKLAGYSGSDIVQLAREAAMRPVRQLLAAVAVDGDSTRGPPAGAAAIGSAGTYAAQKSMQALEPRLVSEADLAAALHVVKPSAHRDLDKYAAFDHALGSTTVCTAA